MAIGKRCAATIPAEKFGGSKSLDEQRADVHHPAAKLEAPPTAEGTVGMTKAPDLTNTDITTGDVKITESEKIGKKYLLIKVPDFDTDPSGNPDPASPNHSKYGKGMTSYLRLGVPTLTGDIGDDLIDYAFDAGPAGKEDGSIFIDDERNRGTTGDNPAGSVGHGMTSDDRKNFFTTHLKTKGGWRDHSDGNRITTTYGDKVEVIRGNYKMVVMGRQDDAGNGMGWDVSGNHVQDYAQATMPGASVAVEWIQNAYVPNQFPALANDVDGTQNVLGGGKSKSTDNTALQAAVDAAAAPDHDSYGGGAWLLINSTERVYQYSRNAGNFRTQQWGDKLETYTGSENPARIGIAADDGYHGQPDDAKYHDVAAANYTDDDLAKRLRPSSIGLPRGNPHIVEKTWASKIESYTGSSSLPVPSIVEKTYADWISGETHCTNTITDKTYATDVTEESHVTGTTTSTSVIGNVVETTTAGTITGATTVGVLTDVTTAGNITEVTTAGLSWGFAFVGNTFELGIGIGHESIEIMAGRIDIGIGPKIEIDIFGEAGLEITVGKATEINVPDEEKIKLERTEAILSDIRVNLTSNKNSLTDTNTALKMTMRALEVGLGI